MIVNTVLTRHVHELKEIEKIAEDLRKLDFEVKISTTSKQVILATNALSRTLRRVREVNPMKVGGISALMTMMVGVSK